MHVLISFVTSRSFEESLLTYNNLCGKRSSSLSTAQFASLCLSPFILLPSLKHHSIVFISVTREAAKQCHHIGSTVWPTQKAPSPSLNPGKSSEVITMVNCIMTRSKINLLPYLFQVLHVCILQTKQSRDPASSTSSFHWKPALFQ